MKGGCIDAYGWPFCVGREPSNHPFFKLKTFNTMDAQHIKEIVRPLADAIAEAILEKVAEGLAEIEAEKAKQMEGGVDFAAAFLDLAKTTIRIYCHEGKIPHYKKGGRLWFKREELEQYLEDRGHY